MDVAVCLVAPCAEGALTAVDLVRVAASVFLGILFLQSGIDKVVDRQGNMAWLTGHFAKSPLASQVSAMLASITFLELAAGLCSALGAATLLLARSRMLSSVGALLSVAAILALFFGQRMAKDYAGAAALVPYFLLACGTLALLGSP
jgi:uncharacterized membrane protein YphA (DoxX/SURF4 family)